jgi:hypothetical protein
MTILKKLTDFERGYEQGKADAAKAQEPVAHCIVKPLRWDEFNQRTEIVWVEGKPISGPLYTTPPQRPWVGLTDDDYETLSQYAFVEVIEKIEAVLKEKNT